MPHFRVALFSMLLSAFSAAAASAEPFVYVLGIRAGTSESVVTVIDTATNAKLGSLWSRRAGDRNLSGPGWQLRQRL